ncbi:MAG: PAS domain S-box protein, partial [Ignavibacteria bacterium]|nr:PAS domain S-box protein [Ignavibacteria bacterium]
KKGYPEGHVELTKYLTLPIFDGDEIVAVIGVANKESDYDEMDVMQLRLMMNSVWRIVKRKESEDKSITLSKAVEQNPVSIIITDPDGIIEYVNPSFEKLSGYNSADIIGKNPRILKSGHHTKEFYENLWTTIKAGNDFKCEMKNRKKNGEFYWENTVLSPITNEHGKISHFIAVKEDITEKKKMVEELISAKEKAEEMSRLKSNFLANMSHELRTPLNGILGYADYLTSQLKEPELIETSQGIYDSGKRLSETLNFILDLSEAETEHVEILTADVDVIPLVKDTLRSFAKEAAAKNLRFETIIKEENIFARIEARLFNRILYNLLDNALKFTKKGIITFEIGREPIGNREWFYFKVTDSGIGIAKDKIDVVWDEFRQVSEGLTRTYEGVGLGLTISKKAVELMQGVITVESELGVGSTFTVEFPALSFLPKKEEEIQVQRIIPQDQPAVFQPGKEKNGTAALPLLLYIEDDFANRNVIKFFLKNSCSVETVEDGEEALQLIKQNKYDVILVDINLGEGMNGMAVVKEVLKMPQYADTPLIAVTAFAMEDDKAEFLKGGFTHYISKPFNKKELIDLVTGALKHK